MGAITYDLVPRASGVEVTTAATYDLALADARANAAAGDYYRLTTDGGVWRVFGSGATAFLVPADWYDRLTVVSNASGSCFFTLADDLAAMAARGWVAETNASGTATKSAAGPLELDASSTSNSYGRVVFTPTSAPDNFFWIAKIRAISASGGTPAAGYAGILCRNSADLLKLGLSSGATFAGIFCSNTNFNTGADGDSTDATFSAGWLMGILDAGAGDALLVQQVGAGLRACLMPSDEAAADANGRLVRVECLKSTSGVVMSFDVDEFLCCQWT